MRSDKTGRETDLYSAGEILQYLFDHTDLWSNGGMQRAMVKFLLEIFDVTAALECSGQWVQAESGEVGMIAGGGNGGVS